MRKTRIQKLVLTIVYLMGTLLFHAQCFGKGEISAESVNGNLLIAGCESTNSQTITNCDMYILGSIDQLWYTMTSAWGEKITSCVWSKNKGVTRPQMLRTAKKYLHDHPEKLQYSSSSLIAQAILDNFISEPIKECTEK